MFPNALSTDEAALVADGTSALTNVGLGMAAVAGGGLILVGLRAIYKSVTTAIASRGRAI